MSRSCSNITSLGNVEMTTSVVYEYHAISLSVATGMVEFTIQGQR